MILLKIPLNNDDNNYLVLELKLLLSRFDNKSSINCLKHQINLLAENGQIESIEYYYSNLTPTSHENTKIFKQIKEIEKKPIKEARDYMALLAYYDWQIKRNIALTKEPYTECYLYPKVVECNEKAMEELRKLQGIDALAKEYLFEQPTSSFEVKDNFEISNFRSSLHFKASQQINDSFKYKLLYAYAKNLIKFAPEQELIKKKPIINSVIQYYQKSNTQSPELS